MSSLIISSLSLILSNINTVSSTITTHTHGDPLSSSCIGKEDGDYWLLLSSDNTDYLPLHLRCSNEYVILDISKDLNLKNYFSSFEKWHHSIGGPANHDPVNWREWFLYTSSVNYNKNSKYILSPDCNTCDESYLGQVYNTDTTYWMTGNLAKLHWFVIGFNECDMDYYTYQCYNCISCEGISGACDPTEYSITDTDFDDAGTCGVTVQSSQHQVYKSREIAQGASILNYKPSTGTGGAFCVCYKPENDKEYYLNDEQEGVISDYYNNNNNEELNEIVEDKLMVNKNDKDGVIELRQEDFEYGTYRIKESGKYIIMEDIVFDFNPNDDYWPRADQEDTYEGADSYRDPYHLGFFAGITIESDNVEIDLNGKELKMSVNFYYQQRWFAIIELGNQQFLAGQGPEFFGSDPVTVTNVVIRNGVLGLTSHFAIHGNYPTDLTIESVHMKYFVTHGMQLNGWENLIMKNVEIGPSSTYEYLRGDYGHARIILQRLRKIETDIDGAGVLVGTKKIKFDNHDNEMTLGDFGDNLEEQMNLAFEYAVNRFYNKHADTDYITSIDIINNEQDKLLWQATKKQFIQESGYPSASSISGMFLNFQGASVFSYTMYTSHQSSNGYLENIHIHDIYHQMVESMRMSYDGLYVQFQPTPWNSDIPAEHAFGSKDNLQQFYDSIQNSDDTYTKFKYQGSVMTDVYFALGSLSDSWDYLGFLEIQQSTDDRNDAFSWVQGFSSPLSDWQFGCNQDIMGHSGKGLLGLRIDGVDNVKLNNIKIENLYEMSPLGSNACGEYTAFAIGGGGHFKQDLPMQYGFSGNDLQGLSIIASTNVILGNINIENLNNDYSQSIALSLWTGNDINVKEDGLIKIKDIKAGIKLEEGLLTYTSTPNRSPEACGVRLQDSSAADYYTSYFNVDNLGTNNIIACGVSGHEMCLGSEEDEYRTMYGTHFSDLDTCDQITTVDELADKLELSEMKMGNRKDKKEKVENVNIVKENIENESNGIAYGMYGGIIGVMVLIAWWVSMAGRANSDTKKWKWTKYIPMGYGTSDETQITNTEFSGSYGSI